MVSEEKMKQVNDILDDINKDLVESHDMLKKLATGKKWEINLIEQALGKLGQLRRIIGR